MKNAKRLLALLLALCLTAGLTLPAGASWSEKPAPFEDLKGELYDWPVYCDFIARALELGIFSGTSATTFSPLKPLTRAQAVTALAKTHQAISGETVPSGGSAPFSDVPAGSWYGRYVSWAYDNGLVSGTGNGKFSPGQLVSYAELGVMFHRYLKMMGLDTLYDPVGNYDWDKFPSWAREHLYAISGYEIFSTVYIDSPTVDRGDAARWFVRLYETATFPVDKETLRVKYIYSISMPQPGMDPDHMLDWENGFGSSRKEASILTSYEEFSRLLVDRQTYAWSFEKVSQPKKEYIWEGGFEDHNLLAVETAYVGFPAYDCELGAFSIEGDCAKVTLVEKGLAGSTANLKGVLYFIWVPKDVAQGEITCMSWTNIAHWVPA